MQLKQLIQSVIVYTIYLLNDELIRHLATE